MTIHEFARKLPTVTRKGAGYMATCPVHEGHSLSIDLGTTGAIVLKCFGAHCTPELIVAAMGLQMTDLFPDAAPKALPVLTIPTVAGLARRKGLPLEALTRYGVKDASSLTDAERRHFGAWPGAAGVVIPYFNADGSLAARPRLRIALERSESRWLNVGFGAILPYGLHELQAAREQGLLYLCEGESDYWTLRLLGAPALGIPGAMMVRSTLPHAQPYLEGVAAVYVLRDQDAAGTTFLDSVRATVRDWGVTVYAVEMPAGCKDINDVYRRDPINADTVLADLSRDAANAAPLPAPPQPVFATEGDVYALTLPAHGVRLELDQIRRTPWGDLTGELAVFEDGGEDWFRGGANLSDVDKRQRIAKQLTRVRPGPPWDIILDDFAVRGLKARKTGVTPHDLRLVPDRPVESVWEIDGFQLARQDASCFYADGGTGKSLLALYVLGVLARQGVKVAYVDAEWHESVHKERLRALFGDTWPRVDHLDYRGRTLIGAVEGLQRTILTERYDYLVLDSVGVLTGGGPETSEAAMDYSRALQRLGIGSLSLAHIRKAGDRPLKPREQKVFGSVMYQNLFRRAYFLQAEEDQTDPLVKRLLAWDNKQNHRGGLQPPFGVEIRDEGDRTTIRRVDAMRVEGLRDKLPLWKRIAKVLAAGPKTVAELAEDLDESQNCIKTTLNRGRVTRYVTLPGSRPPQWALRVDDEEDRAA